MGSAELDEAELRHRIEAGIEAADELKRRLEREESRKCRTLRLIKGGLIGAGIWAGVEWLRGYRRVAVGVLASTAAASGFAYVMPAIPDPPSAEIPPPKRHVAEPNRPPTPKATVTLKRPASVVPSATARETGPLRTSPPRTTPTATPISVTPTKPPATVVVSSITETPLPTILPTPVPTPTLPSVATPQLPDCPLLSLDPLGVCLEILGTE